MRANPSSPKTPKARRTPTLQTSRSPVSKLASHRSKRGLVVPPIELDRLRAELLRAKKLAAVGELAANVAHEVNNVLTVVMGQAQLLLVGSLPEDARERVQKLYSEASQAARIVQSLLNFSRSHPVAWRPVGLSELINRVLDLMRYRLQSNQIRLHVELEAVPSVEGDAAQLQQVLFNLIQNAQQVMTRASGRGALTVRLRAVHRPGRQSEGREHGPDLARIEIEDSGPGIRPELLRRIFNPFFTTKPPGEGAGLGLSLSREIVEAHGGRLWAENRPHGGALFCVELPLRAGTRGS
ncbi:MAG TPA: ATP-binding protein [Methylomirabilota bacterium]|nr:ATP-binding protein [Methylomirabilota bacterium]